VKIDDSPRKPAGVGVGTTPTRGKSADKAGSVSRPAAPATDSVHISSQLQSLTQLAGDNSVFDAKKVEEIRSAIEQGKFEVDAKKVASGLIDTVTGLLNPRKG
jgi:negative regulator of flagellin synthesis FlgM